MIKDFLSISSNEIVKRFRNYFPWYALYLHSFSTRWVSEEWCKLRSLSFQILVLKVSAWAYKNTVFLWSEVKIFDKKIQEEFQHQFSLIYFFFPDTEWKFTRNLLLDMPPGLHLHAQWMLTLCNYLLWHRTSAAKLYLPWLMHWFWQLYFPQWCLHAWGRENRAMICLMCHCFLEGSGRDL